MTPHKQEYEKEIAAIKTLPDEDLAKLRIWQVMELAIPYGMSGEVADTLGTSERAVRSWRVNPDLITDDKENDPSGRRGAGHHFNLLLLAVNGVFPPGAQLLIRWQALKLAKGQAIQGYDRMEAVMQVAEEVRALGDEAGALQSKARALQEKMAAIITGWADTA
jgi:hypothetical protein